MRCAQDAPAADFLCKDRYRAARLLRQSAAFRGKGLTMAAFLMAAFYDMGREHVLCGGNSTGLPLVKRLQDVSPRP